MRSIGILGGSFDPVHHGHERLASSLITHLDVDELRIMPCKNPPHKTGFAASDEQRLAMLNLAFASKAKVRIDLREMRQQRKSYSVLSLTELRAEFADAAMHFAIGWDAFTALNSWYRWQDLLSLANLVVVARPMAKPVTLDRDLQQLFEQRVSVETLKKNKSGCVYQLPFEEAKVSSTQIRRSMQRGYIEPGMLNKAVAQYIREQRLYQQT